MRMRMFSNLFPGAVPMLGVTISLFVAPPAAGQSGGLRTWTDVTGREMRATLLDANGESASFRLPNGREAQVPLNKLSQDDRNFIDEWRTSARFWLPTPPSRQWPDRVSVNWQESEVSLVEESVRGVYVFHSPHFEFEADDKLAPNVVTDFAKLFEVTHAALSQNPLGLRPFEPEKGRFKVRLFSNPLEYLKAGGVPVAAGVYVPKEKWTLVPFQSLGLVKANTAWVRKRDYDPTTLIHETVHQVLDHWLPYAPIWFNEGLANFLSVARYQSGFLVFDRIADAVKDDVRGARGRYNSILMDGPGTSVDFPIEIHKVLEASRAKFMGFHPQEPLDIAEISHHYQTALLLVHFFFYEDDKGPSRLRAYLEKYRSKITENGGAAIEFPDEEDSDSLEMQAILDRMDRTQREAAEFARPTLSEGRDEETLLKAMRAFYEGSSIHVSQREIHSD